MNGDDTTQDPLRTGFVGPRFAIDHDLGQAQGTAFTLDKDQARHARRVLRLSGGAPVQLIDGLGHVAQAQLIGDDPRSADCVVESVVTVDRPMPTIELATAIPKGPRGDAMVNGLAQLGLDRLTPLRTERSVVDPGEGKLERFRKAAVEASKQSGRAHFMRVEPTADLARVLADDPAQGQGVLKLVADPAGKPLAGIAGDWDSVSTVRVLVGPEGGLTDAELATSKEAGFVAWRLSSNVLRIETAAAAAVAILRADA